jgi:antitoxin component of RelBE/YafQ-DinJ toxin-antitoxin module
METILLETWIKRENAEVATRVLARLGLKPSDAVNALFAQIARRESNRTGRTSEANYALGEFGLDGETVSAIEARLRRQIEESQGRDPCTS